MFGRGGGEGRVGTLLISILSESLVFAKNMSEWIICSKKWAICLFAHFWWATWMIHSQLLIPSKRLERSAHITQRECANFLLFFRKLTKKCKKHTKYNLLEFFWAKCSFFVSESEKWAIRSKNLAIRSICSFVLSDLSKLLTFAHLSWATWSNSSHSLTCHERPERFAHSCSFALSDQSKWLTYAHFSWANEWMSKWANSQPWGVGRCGLHEGVALKGDNSLCTLFSRSRAN